MRKIVFIAFLPFLLVFLTSRLSFSQVFRWSDEKGLVHFTDDITQVPERFRPKAERVGGVEETQEAKHEGESAPNKKEDAYKDQLGRGEEYWKGLMEESRKKLRQQEDKLVGLRAKYNTIIERHNESRSTAERANLRRERDQVKREIDECNAQIEQTRGMMDKRIPEEAELYKAKPEWIK